MCSFDVNFHLPEEDCLFDSILLPEEILDHFKVWLLNNDFYVTKKIIEKKTVRFDDNVVCSIYYDICDNIIDRLQYITKISIEDNIFVCYTRENDQNFIISYEIKNINKDLCKSIISSTNNINSEFYTNYSNMFFCWCFLNSEKNVKQFINDVLYVCIPIDENFYNEYKELFLDHDVETSLNDNENIKITDSYITIKNPIYSMKNKKIIKERDDITKFIVE